MQNEPTEFFKLDPDDKKFLFWLMDNKPEKIKSWINNVSRYYNKPGEGLMDAEKLYKEIRMELAEYPFQ